MLTDRLTETDLEVQEEEPWFKQQELEHDLQLAAELGKTLLERNHELEQGLQQMYVTNQEQLQEIEHLSKQVYMLRTVNDQHAKVYEQLDATTRDLEQNNQKLAMDNRAAQLKIKRLTETINGLQCQVEAQQKNKVVKNQQEPDMLYALQSDRSNMERHSQNEHSKCASTTFLVKEKQKDEHMGLVQSVQTLKAQLKAEQSLREAAEQEAKLLAQEITELQPRLSLLDAYKTHLAELETEVEELRHLWRSNNAAQMLPHNVFFPSEDEVMEIGQRRQTLTSFSSERQPRETGSKHEDLKEPTNTVKSWEAPKEHGISLLNEVDAQYSVLQRKYNELLQRCEGRTQSQSHKAVQTHALHLYAVINQQKAGFCQPVGAFDNAQPPEYKMLFKEIFTCIQKSKEDIQSNRVTSS